MRTVVITLLLATFASQSIRSNLLESSRTEVEKMVVECLANGNYETGVMENALHRFYADIDLLLWEGFSIEDKTERLKESVELLLPQRHHDFICMLYQQYDEIILSTLGSAGKEILIENFCQTK